MQVSSVVLEGDALEVMRGMQSDSIDALCCDPPAGIAFMSASWDSNRGSRNNWIAWLTEVMAEALRICKPGAHGFVWALPRTSHWTAMALEDAGWEIRDRCTHVFGQGFPKSKSMRDIGRPELGSALKPSTEDWWLIRKPLSEPSIAANVLTHGTGALAIDACRIDGTGNKTFERHAGDRSREQYRTGTTKGAAIPTTQGRFPSQFLLSHIGGPNGCRPTGEMKRVKGSDRPNSAGKPNKGDGGFIGKISKTMHSPVRHANPDGTEEVAEYICHPSCPIRLMDEQSGPTSVTGKRKTFEKPGSHWGIFGSEQKKRSDSEYTDSGGPSRFFAQFPGFHPDTHPGFIYQAKSSRRERNAGLPEGETNIHSTVKPLSLMRYLAKLVGIPGGTILDPFCGSGTTGAAAVLEGFNFVGIEQDEAYASIARKRIAYWSQPEEVRAKEKKAAPKSSKPSAYGMAQTRVCNVCGSRTRPHTAGGPWPECGHENWRWVGKDAAPVQSSSQLESDEETYPGALPMCPVCKDAPIASGRGVYQCGHNLYYEDEMEALKETLF